MSMLQSIAARYPAADPRSIREIDQEIVEELEFHLEMRVLDNQRQGLSLSAAREAASEQFGDFETIRRTCRRALLGERFMLQRLQTAILVVLLLAVAGGGYQTYSAQKAAEARLAEAQAAHQAALKDLADQMERLNKTNESELEGVKAQLATRLDATRYAAPVSAPAWAADRPRVVETHPAHGATDVDPATSEIRVTFDKVMTDDSWSWVRSSAEAFPESTGDVHYLEDMKTCVMPVELEPKTKYVVWFNTANNQNFKDREGRPAVPHLLSFTTRE